MNSIALKFISPCRTKNVMIAAELALKAMVIPAIAIGIDSGRVRGDVVIIGHPVVAAVGRAQHRHVMTPHVPGRREQRRNQAAREYASRLQRAETENLTPVVRVEAPVVDDVKNFRTDDPEEDNQNAKVPGIVAIDALLLGIAHADPKPDQHSRCDQDAIGG